MLINLPCRPDRRRDIRSRARLLLLGATLALGGSPASSFTLEESGEWVVSCENTAACSLVNASQLTQLRVAQPSPFGMSRVCINRRAGPHATAQVFVTLRNRPVMHPAASREARSLRVFGANFSQSDIPMLHRGAEHWEVPARAVAGFLTSIGDASRLHVIGPEGAVVEHLSLHGIDRALAVIDRAQERAGTVTALREKGSRPASSVLAENRPEALVTAPLAVLAAPHQPSAAALRLRHATCGAPGLDATTGYRLLGDQRRPDRILWVTPCDSREGMPRSFFVIQQENGAAAPVAFPGNQPERPSGQQGLLTFPQFDAGTGQVREMWREPVVPAPGKACIIQRLWGWNGEAFELAEERRSLTCAGLVTGYSPRTFTRDVIMPATSGLAPAAEAFRPPC
ncbi:MAG: DUF1176 domain-containing protein [Phreatobacter sp.]|uniref:DUF1176 domain-containing protein n=1 Tax=Phreatobacter sp. TaxID=1966341 RepID=UPI0027373E02|nr:DUF1176 domain-containing protein [Phreatobacter sp.]MDP2800720.1 DUF1176 domain-containing protein [Phreatobacter sp.]